MKRTALFIIWMACFFNVKAQKEGYVWVFGNKAGLDFNSGSPIAIQTNITTIEGSASVCSATGQLLFYTEGSTIWDRNGTPMPNGSNITGLMLPGYSPTASTTQSSLIVPMPDSAGKYYLFSLTDGTIHSIHNLYYSVVDMSLNGGLGDIVPGRKGIWLDSMLSEKLTGVVGKCCNIWVVVNKTDGHFNAFEITATGLNKTAVSSASGINNGFSYNYGEIKFSPNGNMMSAVSQSFFGLRLYDFDGYTGIFSNERTIKNKDFYGTCFSPDNTKLYAASDTLYQYDLNQPTTAAIINSEKKIAKTGGLTDVKLGPDDKIYFQGFSGISVVNQPNLTGTAAQVQPNAISLLAGTNAVFGGLSNEVPVLRRDTAVFVHTDTSVCFKDSIQLTAPGCHYTWDNGSTDINRTVYHNGDYVVQYYTPACTYHADTMRAYFASAVPFAGVYSGCGQAGTAYLYVHPGDGDNFSYTYTWQDSSGNQLQQHTSTTGDTLYAIAPGKYDVYMSGNGCDTTVQLILLPPAIVSASFTTDTLICAGDTSVFTNTSQGLDTYLWVFDDGSTSPVASPKHYYVQPGIYHVMLIGYPCGDTARATVTVDTGSYLSFTTDKDHYCKGETIIFNMSYPTGAVDIAWNFGDDGDAVLHDFDPKHGYDHVGQYIIQVMAQFRACRDTSFSDTLSVYDYPVVTLRPDTFMCSGDNPITLLNLANTPASYHYQWNTGDTSVSIMAMHPDNYYLTVTNDHQCATTDSIDIRQSCYIAIPNVFTPNGDGVNDYFFPRQLLSEALASFHIQIFDRWGQKVFETTSTDGRGWDGRYGDKPMPDGVYIYLIEASFSNGIAEKYKGNVTLIR